MAITIFTDGSSRGNPGPGGWGAIIRTDDEVTELGGGEGNTTNNRMELSAAINALVFVSENGLQGPIVVQSDSKYVIQGITEWVSGWQRNGWKTAGKKDVGNRDLWETLAFAAKDLSIQWKYVQGHAGHPGNERCDEIATSCADQSDPHLFQGARKLYTIDLDAAPPAGAAAVRAKKRSSSAAAYSYLSLVDGVLEKHRTWAECESRVKGVKGARFKKSVSAADEAEIIKEWGR
ncbi:MAG TPA: ribonuclease HI [Candidatus Paceibacterota bacterium]|nr:ribonuclease HI [Candidatus Paceibacterota bacterium]